MDGSVYQESLFMMVMESFYINFGDVKATYTEHNYESRQKYTFEYGDMARGVGLNDEGISCHELDLDRGA
jgi:hypothetical protein